MVVVDDKMQTPRKVRRDWGTARAAYTDPRCDVMKLLSNKSYAR